MPSPNARAQIENLLAAYTYAMDDSAWDALGDLFAKANFRIQGQVFRGRAGMADFTGQLRLHDGKLCTQHLLTNISVWLDEEAGTARSRSYWTVLQTVKDLPLQVVTAGQYLDTFEHSNDEWAFVERTVTIDLVGDTSMLW